MAGCMAYASTAGFESVCEAIYLEKPVLMVPSHIEQECNAFDAMKSGAGVSADKFDLSLLLDFTKGFIPDKEFGQWARSAEAVIINELEIHYKDSDILVNKIKRKFEK
jgi:UDP:flavonoid glycosyltransferase YjiC (YdhE family)